MARKIFTSLMFLLLLGVTLQPSPVRSAGSNPPPFNAYLPSIHSPWQLTPMWAYGGCYSSWCETGWYSSPAVADVNGSKVILASAYSLIELDSAGKLLWRAGTTNNRTWPGVVVSDIDNDGSKEVVIAQSSSLLSVYRLDGSLKWKKTIDGGKGELRGLLVADLDGDGKQEVVVTRAYGSAQNTWVFDSAGNARAGWPQLSTANDGTHGYAWGVYNANAAAADINNDGKLELVVPSDVHYINAYTPSGGLIPSYISGKTWGQVGVWENLVPEQRGYGECDGTRVESYRTNFADGPAVITSLTPGGPPEIVVTGNMYDCYKGYPPSQYTAAYIFNPDRSRYNSGGYNWTSIPINTGAPLSEDYDKIESAEANPAVADLDGDGNKEIVFSSYDGRVHAFWLDKTEHGHWPYAVTKPGDGYLSFASEPVIADLGNDGRAEVIFSSWTQKGSHHYGKLTILDSNGNLVAEVNLPAPLSGSDDWNGALAAPTLADIDGDGNLEVILNTANSGIVVYKLPGTQNARVLWGTGRGSYTRSGAQ